MFTNGPAGGGSRGYRHHLRNRGRTINSLRLGLIVLSCLAGAGLAGCQPEDATDASESMSEEPQASSDVAREPVPSEEIPPLSAPQAGVVEVTARDFAFQAPDRIGSGWTTIRFANEGQQEHFMVLWRLPEDKSFQQFMDEVVMPFREGVEPYRAGEVDRQGMMELLGELLPEWFADVEGAGGPGMTSPGRVSQTTVKLEPGDYVMECYVRAPDGRFHNELGMLKLLTVTEEKTGSEPPDADASLTLSNYAASVDGALSAGEQTVRVDFADEPEGMLSHDIHLARLGEDTDLDDVVAWMDWVDEMQTPGPAEFFGGAEHMPAGSTAYVTVDLEPGRYAWISELYGPRGVVQEFSVQ